MMMRNIFGDAMLDEFFNDFTRPMKDTRKVNPVMSTDIKEFENGYELAIDLPGFKKEDVKAELKNGYLTVSAERKSEEENAENGRYLRRESFRGTCSRTFYVGERVKQEDIKARFENGLLIIAIPKPQPEIPDESKRYIAIEG